MDPVALSVVLGAVSPLVLAVAVQTHWSARAKSAFVFIVCAAAGLEVAAASGQLHMPHNAADAVVILADVAAVYAASQAVYKGLKASGLPDAIEARTNLPRIPRIRIQVGEPQPPTVTPPDAPLPTVQVLLGGQPVPATVVLRPAPGPDAADATPEPATEAPAA